MADFFTVSFGLMLLILPFFLIFFYKDKFKAFLDVSLFSISFQVALALVTQLLGVFTYSVILSANIIFVSLCYFYFLKKKDSKFKIDLNWFLLIAVIIMLFQFNQPHFNYTGKVNTINGIQKVEKSKYLYPYFSDEWVAVSLVNYTIKSHSLPSVNSLWLNEATINPLLVYFSTISTIFLITGLNPLTSLSIISILTALFIGIFSFILLRKGGVGRTASVVPVLLLPTIVNGANLPGLWYTMPFTVSLTIFLASLIYFSENDIKKGSIAILLTLILYPAMIVFVFPVVLLVIFKSYREKRFDFGNLTVVILSILLPTFTLLILSIFNITFADLMSIIKERILHEPLDRGTPRFGVWNVLPFYVVFIAVFGIINQFNKKFYIFLTPIFTGLIFWSIYSLGTDILIIDYPRVVVITSILLVISTGFAFNSFFNKIFKQYFSHKSDLKLIKYFKLLFLAVFVVYFAGYTQNETWKKFVLVTEGPKGELLGEPAPPVNAYLHEDDLKLFKDIGNKIFIAPPWKGLVIGVSTGNYPLESKSSTISNSLISYNKFIVSDCDAKKRMSKGYVDYVFSKKFMCKEFQEIGSTREGYYLYKFLEK